MPLETIIEHEYDDGTTVTVVKGKRVNGEYAFIFCGPDALETVIEFDEVQIDTHTIEFYRKMRGRRNHSRKVGSIEGNPEHHGPVGYFLEGVGNE